MLHSESDEAFLQKPSVVNETLILLDNMLNSSAMDDTSKEKKAMNLDFTVDDEFLVRRRNQNLVRFSKKRKSQRNVNVDQFTFMRQLDQTIEQRIQARSERERVAQCFRRLGNDEYRKGNYENAIAFYSKGITYIKDSPVLYCNRAVVFLKTRNYKRVLVDCDYVLINIDPKCLRAWLYKAAACKRLGDEKNYEECAYQALKLNANFKEYIDTFLFRMKSEL